MTHNSTDGGKKCCENCAAKIVSGKDPDGPPYCNHWICSCHAPAPTTSPEEERCICAKGRGMDVIHNFLCPLSNPPTPKDNKPQSVCCPKCRADIPQPTHCGMTWCPCHTQTVPDKETESESRKPTKPTNNTTDDAAPTNNGWEEEFDKNLPPSGVDWREKTESEIYQFGYKVLRGNEIFTVVDWANIKKFISTLLTAEREKVKNHEQMLSRGDISFHRERHRNEGRTQTKDAILSLIEGMRKVKVPNVYQGSHKMIGWNAALTDLASKIADI